MYINIYVFHATECSVAIEIGDCVMRTKNVSGY